MNTKNIVTALVMFICLQFMLGCGISKDPTKKNNDGRNGNETAAIHDTVYVIVHDTVYVKVYDTIYVEQETSDGLLQESDDMTHQKKGQQLFGNARLQPINNDAYILRNTHLVLHGIGESIEREVARQNAMDAAEDSLLIVMREAVRFITEKRGMKNIAINNLTATDTEDMGEKTQGYKDKRGQITYRITQPLKFKIEPILKDIYSRMKPSKNYSYQAFCRDFDFLISKLHK